MRLFTLILACCLALPAQAELRYELQPKQIAENVWLLEGSTDNFEQRNGGNIVNTGFIVTEAGVVVIDSGPSKRYGEAMREAIAGVTDRPVIKVLLTHHHPDHVLGNQAFADVPIAALAGTTELLREQGDAMAENMYRLVGDWMRGTEVVLPNETLQPGTLEIGGHRLRLLALRGHTGADLAILDENSGVLFASDILFYQRALVEQDVAGEQHTTVLIEYRQIGAGMPAQGEQTQPVAADFQRAGLQRLVRQHDFGATHPVADQPVHVFRHRISLLAQQLGGAGQRGDGDVGECLVAEHMVRMVMGEQHLDHRTVGDARNGLAHGLAVAFRRPAVDHHHARLGDDEAGVDDVAAVALLEVVGRAFQQPDILGDLFGLQLVAQLGLRRQRQAAGKDQGEKAHDFSLAG